jgi:hypothetical protein
MKAYQVFEGGFDKNGNQYFKLISTHLDRQKAFDHAIQIVESISMFHDNEVEFSEWFDDQKYCYWAIYGCGWEKMIITRIEEIEITE